MLRVFLAHTPEMFAGYYGNRTLAALRDIAEVIRNPGETVLQGKALAHLRGHPQQAFTADDLAQALGLPDQAETLHHVLAHAAANPDHRISRSGGDSPRGPRCGPEWVPRSRPVCPGGIRQGWFLWSAGR